MGSAAIDLTGLMLGDALDRAKASFDIFEKSNTKKTKKKPSKKKSAKKKAKPSKAKLPKKPVVKAGQRLKKTKKAA